MKTTNNIKVLSSIKRFLKNESVVKVIRKVYGNNNDISKYTYYLTNDKQIVKTYYNHTLHDITLLNDYATGYYRNNQQWHKTMA